MPPSPTSPSSKSRQSRCSLRRQVVFPPGSFRFALKNKNPDRVSLAQGERVRDQDIRHAGVGLVPRLFRLALKSKNRRLGLFRARGAASCRWDSAFFVLPLAELDRLALSWMRTSWGGPASAHVASPASHARSVSLHQIPSALAAPQGGIVGWSADSAALAAAFE